MLNTGQGNQGPECTALAGCVRMCSLFLRAAFLVCHEASRDDRVQPVSTAQELWTSRFITFLRYANRKI